MLGLVESINLLTLKTACSTPLSENGVYAGWIVKILAIAYSAGVSNVRKYD
jgi:hypothetical protein